MGGSSFTISLGNLRLKIIDEPGYTPDSVDNVHTYDREYWFTDSRYHSSSKHGLIVYEHDLPRHSCLLLAGGGGSGVHEHSAAIIGDICYIAAGDSIASLRLPTLELQWHRQVDEATCFGIYHSVSIGCLFSHGEMEIARVGFDGELIWSVGGEDIFTEGFELHPDRLEVIDFNRKIYLLDLATGKCL